MFLYKQKYYVFLVCWNVVTFWNGYDSSWDICCLSSERWGNSFTASPPPCLVSSKHFICKDKRSSHSIPRTKWCNCFSYLYVVSVVLFTMASLFSSLRFLSFPPHFSLPPLLPYSLSSSYRHSSIPLLNSPSSAFRILVYRSHHHHLLSPFLTALVSLRNFIHVPCSFL